VTPSTMPRITALIASDIMIWSVMIDIDRKSRAFLAYSPLCRNRKSSRRSDT
jgi:hypothetical protein